jgi:hypothetical protein
MTATREARRERLGVLTGSLFVVLWFAGTIVQGLSGAGFPRPTDDMATVADIMRAGASSTAEGAGLFALSAVALLWFTAILATHLRRAGRPGPAADLVRTGGTAAALTLLGSAASSMALGGTDLVSDDASAQLLYQLSFWLGGPLHVAALGTMIVGAARGLHGPRWLTIAGLVVGAAGMAASLSLIVPSLMLFTPIGRFLGFLWIVVATVLVAFGKAATGESVAPAAEEPARV